MNLELDAVWSAILFIVGAFFGLRVVYSVRTNYNIVKEQTIDSQTKLGQTMVELAEAREVLKNTIENLKNTKEEMLKTKKELEEVEKKTFSFISNAKWEPVEDMIKKLEERIFSHFHTSGASTSLEKRIEILEEKVRKLGM